MNETTHETPLKVSHLINGEWDFTGEPAERLDPYRGTVISTSPQAGPELVEKAVAAAVEAAPKVTAIPGYKRQQILYRAAELIEERAEKIGYVMAGETGKSLSDAVAEVSRSQDTLRLSAEEAVRIEGSQVSLEGSAMGAGKIAFTLRVPVGVVGAITPFNAPFNLACHKIGPALAAGNALVLKAPPQTPGVLYLLAQLMVDAGAPAGSLNIIHGGNDAGRALVTDPRVDFVTFTGSSAAGREIRKSVGLRRVALELGGNGQTIVHSDADIAEAAALSARNAMRLSGQSCISVQNVLVHRSVKNQFLELLVEGVKKLTTGDPLEEATDVGTLIDEAAAQRVENWITEAVASGAKLLTGGQRTGAQLTPAVLTDVVPEMKVCKEEVFGPVVSVLEYEDLGDAISLVNSSRYGLQTGLMTASNEVMMRGIREIRSGAVIVNGTSTWRTDQMPYGGLRDSGIGREGPRYAIHDMTDERLVVFNM